MVGLDELFCDSFGHARPASGNAAEAFDGVSCGYHGIVLEQFEYFREESAGLFGRGHSGEVAQGESGVPEDNFVGRGEVFDQLGDGKGGGGGVGFCGSDKEFCGAIFDVYHTRIKEADGGFEEFLFVARPFFQSTDEGLFLVFQVFGEWFVDGDCFF